MWGRVVHELEQPTAGTQQHRGGLGAGAAQHVGHAAEERPGRLWLREILGAVGHRGAEKLRIPPWIPTNQRANINISERPIPRIIVNNPKKY